jgi:hypothetical protein
VKKQETKGMPELPNEEDRIRKTRLVRVRTIENGSVRVHMVNRTYTQVNDSLLTMEQVRDFQLNLTQKTWCLLHLPKAGGSSIEAMLKLPHGHDVRRSQEGMPPCFNGTRFVMTVRDPVDRMRSAFDFCRVTPWDGQLRKEGLDSRTHCCGRDVVRHFSNNSLGDWLRAASRLDCRLPGFLRAPSLLAPASAWGEPDEVVRLHCAHADSQRLFGHSLPLTNTGCQERSRRTRCHRDHVTHACDVFGEHDWPIVATAFQSDFLLAYGRRITSYHDWRETFCDPLALRKTCTQPPLISARGGGRVHVVARNELNATDPGRW